MDQQAAPPAGDAAAQPRGAHWTPERVERLKELWAQNLSLSAIARTLGGINRNQVVGKVHRLKLAVRPSPLVAANRAWYRSRDEAPAEAERFPVSSLIGSAPVHALLGLPVPEAAPIILPEPAVPEPGPAEPSAIEALFGPRGVSAAVESLKLSSCRWPVGDPKDGDFHFCGAPKKGKAYCAAHERLAYQEPHGRPKVQPRPVPRLA